jgi:hypothetical protein
LAYNAVGMSDGIGIALIGLGVAVVCAALSGFSTLLAAGATRGKERHASIGLLGLTTSLGAAAGLVGGVLFGSTVIRQGGLPSASEAPWREVEVLSDRGWQDTGLILQGGRQFRLEYVSGSWTYWGGTLAPFDAEGDSYVCGRAGCCEPLPGGRKGALIGALGDEVFFVGNGGVFTARSDGRLLLRINDCDTSLADNEGAVRVRIIP